MRNNEKVKIDLGPPGPLSYQNFRCLARKCSCDKINRTEPVFGVGPPCMVLPVSYAGIILLNFATATFNRDIRLKFWLLLKL